MDVLAALAVGLVVAGGPVALERVTTLDLPGLDPGGVVVNRDTHDLVIWECENDKVSFVEAAFNRLAGTFAFQLAEETVSSSGDTFQDCAIFYDPQSRLVHYVGQSSGTTSFSINFERVFVWSLRDRASIGAVFINPDGDTPSSAPEDFRFVINGIGFKPAGADGNANARLIIDDTIKGNLHVVDVDQFGNSTAINRYSYRARHESSCQWPDIDPGPFYSCSFDTPDGSGLALDWGRSPDELFMADHLFNPFLVRRFQVNGAPAEAASINVFDLSGSFGTGAQSLHALPGDDRLLVLTAAESFDEGLIIELDTSSFGLNGIFFDFRDLRAVAVDPSDPSHFFVPVQDFEFSTSVGPLLVREFRGQSEVASILVNSDYDASFNDPVLAFDPDYQLLYVASEDRIDVFRTGQPQGPFPNPDRDDVEAPSPVSIGSGDRFGSAVALAGNLLAVGAPNNSDGLNTGTVSIFRR
ncbi:MAG: FG-GAP repeat protein, partial [Xanthomonadales bacterium]|nr:FG-GAP repeat protein [Xanthomonadales bacterium]